MAQKSVLRAVQIYSHGSGNKPLDSKEPCWKRIICLYLIKSKQQSVF